MNSVLQTELHRHLDVSLRPATLLELAKERGLEAQSTSLDAFVDKLLIREPMKDLAAVLGSFQICQKVLDRPEVLERVARCQSVGRILVATDDARIVDAVRAAGFEARMTDPAFFRRDAREQRADQDRAQAIEIELLALLEKWEALERRAEESPGG
jgi:hypothetical protein